MMVNAAYKLAESVELQTKKNELVERKRQKETQSGLAVEVKIAVAYVKYRD